MEVYCIIFIKVHFSGEYPEYLNVALTNCVVNMLISIVK